jgi:tRNA isopentenyl-2-thiomethyl-A-37 hydroxylase MiaE
MVKDWKKIYHANSHQNQAGLAIFILEKVDFKLTLVKRDKVVHFILVKRAIHQEKISIINLYASNFIRHTLKELKSQIDANTIVLADFNTCLSPIKTQQRNSRTK